MFVTCFVFLMCPNIISQVIIYWMRLGYILKLALTGTLVAFTLQMLLAHISILWRCDLEKAIIVGFSAYLSMTVNYFVEFFEMEWILRDTSCG